MSEVLDVPYFNLAPAKRENRVAFKPLVNATNLESVFALWQ